MGHISHLVCPSVPYRFVTQKQKNRKIKIGTNVSKDTSKWSVNFQLKRSKVKVMDVININQLPHV